MEENTAKKMVVELIGGVGTGKSRVLDILKEDYQAVVIQADEVAKHLEEKGQAGLIKLTEAFGTGILDSEGNLSRDRLRRKYSRIQRLWSRSTPSFIPWSGTGSTKRSGRSRGDW